MMHVDIISEIRTAPVLRGPDGQPRLLLIDGMFRRRGPRSWQFETSDHRNQALTLPVVVTGMIDALEQRAAQWGIVPWSHTK
jgi:hypothetical protein